jgi:hypothetical protein
MISNGWAQTQAGPARPLKVGRRGDQRKRSGEEGGVMGQGSENAQRTINNAIAFLSSLVSGTFVFIFASPPPLRTTASSSSSSSNQSPYPFPKPSRDDARSSPASRPISTSSTEPDTSSSASALGRLAAACAIRRSSSWTERNNTGRKGVCVSAMISFPVRCGGLL